MYAVCKVEWHSTYSACRQVVPPLTLLIQGVEQGIVHGRILASQRGVEGGQVGGDQGVEAGLGHPHLCDNK